MVDEIGGDRFDEDLLAMEFTLSTMCGDHSDLVGFRDGCTLNFSLLRPSGLDQEVANCIRQTSNAEDVKNTFALLDERRERINGVLRGYNGWLLTSSGFLREHESLFRDLGSEFGECGIPQPVQPIPKDTPLPHGWQERDSSQEPGIVAVRDFCSRWRLARIQGSYLPEPLPPQLPTSLPELSARYAENNGALIYIPDTFPLFSRDEIQQIIEDAVRGNESPPHIAEWVDMVRSENTGKNAIGRYGRIFEVQHYCRTLYQRHAKALHRKQRTIQESLASFLDVSPDTIRLDFQFLKRRFGNEWYLQSATSDLANDEHLKS